MNIRLKIVTATFVLVAALASGVAIGQQIAPGPVPRVQSTFEPVSLPVPAEIVQAVLDFPAGTVVPPHVHGGTAYITILEGELEVVGPAGSKTYRVGDTLVEQPGEIFAASNQSDTTASLVVTYIIPKGAPTTTVVSE
ncbi:MAG: cupin domain-containing protein [Dehalococcoidia bacterium]